MSPEMVLEFFASHPQVAAEGAIIALFWYGVRSVIPNIVQAGITELANQRELDREERRLEREDARGNIERITSVHTLVSERVGELASHIVDLAHVVREIKDK